MPTLVILGQDDAVVDNASTEEIFAKLSCSRKVIAKLPGQHGIQFDAPEQVNQTLSSWIFHSNGDSH